jgi:hypothetical protein
MHYRIVSPIVVALVLAVLGGCTDANAGKRASDFTGEWVSADGETPSLQLDAKGEGVMALALSTRDGNALSIARVKLERQDGTFFVKANMAGADVRADLALADAKTMKMTVTGGDSPKEFTLRKK